MKKKFSNPCIRCGRERVFVRSWEEKIGESIIINTQTTCPNPECQKEVDKDNKKQRDRMTAMRNKSLERAEERKIARTAQRLTQKNKKKK